MSELRLVPAALLCWVATWIVLAHRGWALPLLLVAVTAGIAWWLRHSGQALVLCALGSAAVLLTYLRVRAGSRPLPPLLMGRVEAAPRPVHDGVWLLRIHGETVFYRAATCAAKVGDTVQVRMTARASERIGASSHVASATHLDIIQHAGGIQAWMAGVREGFYGASISRLGEGSAQLLPAMVLGDTRGLNMDLYAGAGLAHLSAVSGSNVAIVTTSMVLLARALTLGPRVQISMAGAALVGFVLLVGLEPSVLRAAVTGVVGLVAVLANSRSQPIHALSLAVIGLVLWDSDMAASYGFALSVVATAGIVALHPLLFRALARVRCGRVVMPEILARCLAVAIAADLVTMPIVALMSGKISAVSVLACGRAAARPGSRVGAVGCAALRLVGAPRRPVEYPAARRRDPRAARVAGCWPGCSSVPLGAGTHLGGAMAGRCAGVCAACGGFVEGWLGGGAAYVLAGGGDRPLGRGLPAAAGHAGAGGARPARLATRPAQHPA